LESHKKQGEETTMGEPVPPIIPTGGMATFNMHHGFAEALVRGLRSGFLGDSDYHHLTQCETLEDVKMNLQETDYDQFLADAVAVTPAIIQVCINSYNRFQKEI
jgi:hypothetical protein